MNLIQNLKKINVLIVGTSEMSKSITYSMDLSELLDIEDKEFYNYLKREIISKNKFIFEYDDFYKEFPQVSIYDIPIKWQKYFIYIQGIFNTIYFLRLLFVFILVCLLLSFK